MTNRISKTGSHADTGANLKNAPHPEFEMWNMGIHARCGVACADCHMPYKSEGAKIPRAFTHLRNQQEFLANQSTLRASGKSLCATAGRI